MADERQILDISQLVNGAEGTVYMQRGNEMLPILSVNTLTATVEKNKEEKNVLGTKRTFNRLTNYTFSGSMTVYYCSSYWAQMLAEDIKNGTNTRFTLVCSNEDPASGIGTQTIALYGVDIDSADIFALDIEASDMTQDIDFTFDDFEVISAFETTNL